jgi:hypothetical protein
VRGTVLQTAVRRHGRRGGLELHRTGGRRHRHVTEGKERGKDSLNYFGRLVLHRRSLQGKVRGKAEGRGAQGPLVEWGARGERSVEARCTLECEFLCTPERLFESLLRAPGASSLPKLRQRAVRAVAIQEPSAAGARAQGGRGHIARITHCALEHRCVLVQSVCVCAWHVSCAAGFCCCCWLGCRSAVGLRPSETLCPSHSAGVQRATEQRTERPRRTQTTQTP